MQGHFGAHIFERFHQEVGCSHPHLDGAEGMLDGLPALAHLFRMGIQPRLDLFKKMLMLPPGDAALLAGGAFIPDGACPAGIRPVAAQGRLTRR